MNGCDQRLKLVCSLYFSPDKSRGSIYLKDGTARTDNSFYIPGVAAAANTLVLNKALVESKIILDPDADLRAKNFFQNDKYGGHAETAFSDFSKWK